MLLTDHEKQIANGDHGAAAQECIAQQIAVGDFFGAERFVPVTNVHMMGDFEVMGEAGQAFLTRLLDLGGKVSVATSRNAQCIEYEYAQRLRQSPELIAHEKDVRALLHRLGVWTVDTCIGYQTLYVPRFNEHIAWGDTGTVAYANGVLGARTNYESGPAALAAAITGRTPEYGFHLDAARRATARIVVEAPLVDVADWGALGAIVGDRVRDYWSVPAIVLGPGVHGPSPDELKHLGAALASHGSLAMFHVVGVTPEAQSEEHLYAPQRTDEFAVTAHDLDAYYANCTPADPAIRLVVFSAPQLSLSEIETIADDFAGRHVADDVTVMITTNAMVKAAADAAGITERIAATGTMLLQGTCWYIMDPVEMQRQFGWTRVVTNSAKLANIIRAHNYEPIVRRTAACVEAAVTGNVA
jgi:predicted aconitase